MFTAAIKPLNSCCCALSAGLPCCLAHSTHTRTTIDFKSLACMHLGELTKVLAVQLVPDNFHFRFVSIQPSTQSQTGLPDWQIIPSEYSPSTPKDPPEMKTFVTISEIKPLTN